jgi:hypothetical protein
MTEPTWRRNDLYRRRLERQCEKLVAEAVRNGDIEMIRINRIRLAAMRFAFDGSVEAHQQVVAFNFEDQRPLNDGDLQRILAIVEESAAQHGSALGVVKPSRDDAKEFVFHVSAIVLALRHGAQFRP